MNKKKELSKGLRSLLSNIESTSNTVQKQEMVRELSSSIALVSLESIEVNPFQPRKEFNEEELMELAKSIKVHGLIQPLTIRSMGDNSYQLISGERRMRASKMAGLKEVPAYIRVANDQEMLEWALIENIQRAELNALEIAISYQRLMEECSLTHEMLSERVGKNRSTITNYVRLLKLPPEIQNSIKEGKISMGHARALAGINDVLHQMDAYKQTISKSWSVRDLENHLREDQPTKAASALPQEKENTAIATKLSNHFGSKILLKRDNSGSGQMVIKFKNDEELNQILDTLGIHLS